MADRFTITVDDSELTDFHNRVVGNLPTFTTKQARGLAQRYANRLKREMIRAGHVNTGQLLKSVQLKKLEGRGKYAVQVAHYMKYLESGTRPHPIPRMARNMLWAKRHGMTFRQMKSIIMKHGTQPHPFSQAVLADTWREMLEDLNLRITAFVKTRGRKVKHGG